MERIINTEYIVDVTKEGVLFIDTFGDVNTILFDECRRNWVEHVNQGGFVDWKDRLKIELKPRGEKQLTKVQREFHVMLYRVGEVATFDMS